jgi:hypothetical protein
LHGVLSTLGEYVESIPNIQNTLQKIRKVQGEILILASEQQLWDEANKGKESNGDANGKKDEKSKEREG